MARNAGVDAMVLTHMRAMKRVKVKRTRAQDKKRKAKRKGGRRRRNR